MGFNTKIEWADHTWNPWTASSHRRVITTVSPAEIVRPRPRALPAFEAPPIAITEDIERLIASNCAIAIGVSGGKDSDACAIAVARHLDKVGHTGPRVLIHADLGRVEWLDSLPSCERLAALLGWELVVVRRKAGDMLARWEGRWENNVARYRELSCVKLILPWSTPSMRFCTSELKTSVITAALKKRYPNLAIINATGVRREESPARKRMPISAPLKRLQRKDFEGVSWNPIIEWPVSAVFDTISSAGLTLHEAYTIYGTTRVSCAYCIMSSQADLRAAASCKDNHDVYRQMVELEARSTFAFQGNHWLGDVAPQLLSLDLQKRLATSKEKAIERQRVESAIPSHLLYTEGWPTSVPSLEEASLIANARREVSELLDLDALYLTPASVRDRYQQLLALAEQKEDEP